MRARTGTGAGGRFPTTRLSAIRDAGSTDRETRERGFGAVVEAYWKPVYKYVRLRWKEEKEAAEDLTQGFFTHAFEKRWFSAYDARRGSFRTFLRTCLDGFVANQRKAARRKRRHPGAPLLSLDFQGAEGELSLRPASAGKTMEDFFHEEFVRTLFASAVAELEALCAERGKQTAFRLFERYDLDPGPEGAPTYSSLGAELGISAAEVTNRLAFARRSFRRIVLAKLRALCGSEKEYREEARAILGNTEG